MNNKDATKLAIYNILKEGTTDVEIFSDFFELSFLKDQEVQKRIIEDIDAALTPNSEGKLDFSKLKFNKIGSVLMPKKEFFDFRKCALVDIIDEIKYLTIVLKIAKKIETKRIIKSKNIIFSYRFKSDSGYLFDPKFNYTTFREFVSKQKKKQSIKVVVETDIANFYDRLNLHRLESNLLAIQGIDEEVISLLNELLLFWANRDSYGLPVGSNASRILAEASLIEVDEYLYSHKINFCRFVDDYRIFAKDSATAQHHLSLLVAKLNSVGLFLNSRKTRVIDVSEYSNTIESNEVDKQDDSNNGCESDSIPDEIINEIASTLEEKRNVFEIPKIIRGYSGNIPTKFRKLTNSESIKLQNENPTELLKSMRKDILLDPKDIVKLTKIIVATESYSLLTEYHSLLLKFPQFLPYITDVLIKYENFLSSGEIQSIKNGFAEWMKEENSLEYIKVYLARLLSTGKFTDKEVLMNSFRSLKRNSGDYIGRALLESLDGILTRTEILEIREYFVRADNWEKRQILRMTRKELSKGENRPFYKDVQIHNSDIMVELITFRKDKYVKYL